MPSIDTTVKGPTANAYCDQTFATDYLTTAVLNSDVWSASTTTSAMKDAALMMATRFLDELLVWKGYDTTVTQALAWPRAFVRKLNAYGWYDQNSIPDIIMQATAELALALLQKNRVVEPDLIGQGFKSGGIAGMSIVVDHNEVLSLIPTSVMAKLQFVSTPRGIGIGHSGSIPMIRG